MSAAGPENPPVSTRFRKGVSGNPKGRPKGTKSPRKSVFDEVFERDFDVLRDGKAVRLTGEEAIEQKLYQAAISGRRAALRQVWGMLLAREKWLRKRYPPPVEPIEVEILNERDPDNADEALALLDIYRGHQDNADPTRPFKDWVHEAAPETSFMVPDPHGSRRQANGE